MSRSGPMMRATVSKPFASTAAGRSVARATSEPMAIRLVSAATAPITVNISSAGRRVPSARHAEEVVVGEHRVEAGGLGRGRDREHRLDLGAERREGEREAGHGSRVRASTAAPTSPASSPSRAGTMSTGRPVAGALQVTGEPRAQRIEEHAAELDQTAGDEHHRGIEDVGQPDQPDRDLLRVVAHDRERVGVAGLRGVTDQHAGDRADVAVRTREQSTVPRPRRRARGPAHRARSRTPAPPSARAPRTRTIGPFGSTWKWPTSAAKPCAPRSTLPVTITIPPPTPVPSVTSRKSSSPCAAPCVSSASAATFASLSMTTGRPVASASSAPHG